MDERIRVPYIANHLTGGEIKIRTGSWDYENNSSICIEDKYGNSVVILLGGVMLKELDEALTRLKAERCLASGQANSSS